MSDDCLVCRKHADADEGLRVFRDERVYVGHMPATPDAYLGHLLVEPVEHLPGLADLDVEQAEAVGRAMRHASATLRGTGFEHVYAFVYGDAVPHLHVHLVGRRPGTPREFWGAAITDWPGALRGGADAVGGVVAELRATWPT
ncbi:histidine triad (HIT) protein [Beutenbergia cavernae DSM 12333]|uniref:Histidine triad (HIT) protein n=1 Tax=Beutenbergia cavernae (strain ATCC BAA-8 / DSM 12333 / CCUG 43141 / JCM 11478 / NBRC 16432 / NCIMB 13614 / HKI 0122) TaxID=471853 RepID=C5C6B8_BEUC1|nr:HIT domain-containing protein [Beutenbergia cavernae]ACQ80324.1 histidine triad (HIT) protein [Beutenbergia cavernae DSM 12333]